MKSHVSTEQHQCPICLAVFDTGAILLQRQMQQTLDRKTMTGHSPCSDCQGKIDQGFVALIEANARRERTGRYAFINTEVWSKVFNVPVPPYYISMVETGILDKLSGN